MKNGKLGRADADLLKGLIAGTVSGLVASWVMNQFQSAWQKAVEGEERGHGAQSMQKGTPEHGIGQILEERGIENPNDDSAQRLSEYVSEEVFEHRLTKSEKDVAGTAFHYAFGVTSGAVYGAASEYLPEVTFGAGLPYGALIWVTADEGVVPLLGLSRSPAEYPLSTHAYAFASHLVYGLANEMTRRAVRNIL
jgi:uncharacterized membrane protein YagU involved in acid resistance